MSMGFIRLWFHGDQKDETVQRGAKQSQTRELLGDVTAKARCMNTEF